MKQLLALMILGTASIHANQYSGSYGDNGGYYRNSEYYQNAPQGYSYTSHQHQTPSGYYDRQDYRVDNRQGNWTDNYNDPRYSYDDRRFGGSSPFEQNRSYQNQYNGFDNSNNPYAQNNSGYNDTRNDTPPIGDQEVLKKVHESISGGWFSKGFERVSFEAYNGNVTLRGTVETQDDKNKIEERVRKIEGVKQVNNQIIVTGKAPNSNADMNKSENKYPQDSAVTEQDRQINAQIRSKLSGWFTSGNNDTIVLKTANGFVVISGKVEKLEDIHNVNEKLKEIDGIQGLNNRLEKK